VFADLIRALPAAAAAAVLPGYFWAAVLRPAGGLGERLAYSSGLSMASVPPVAIVLARVAGTGVKLWAAIASVLIVFGSGAVVYWRAGGAAGPSGPVLPRPARVSQPLTLAGIAAVGVLALATTLHPGVPDWVLLLTIAGLLATGAVAGWRGATQDPASQDPAGPGSARDPAAASQNAASHNSTGHDGTGNDGTGQRSTGRHAMSDGTGNGPRFLWLREGGLAAVLVLTGYRAYSGVIQHDWPFLRGGDQFSHAVMAEQMLAHGSYPTYLVYPPGFPALTAVICRFSGLTPLEVFPVLAPVLLVVTTMGAYALATRLWGWECGLGAAVLSGLVLTGAYAGFAEGRYPDLVSAYFLLVMAVAALLVLYESPSPRPAALVAVLGASVLLYHSVATLYLVVLLALVAVTALPYLLALRLRREAGILVAALAGTAVLAGCYAVYIYELVKAPGGHSATSTAVSIALGSQPPAAPRHLLPEVGPPVVWLGLFGAAVLAAGIAVAAARRVARPAQVLAALTVLLWCVLMYLGSRTAADGFPQRFERDLGAPLSVTGALALGVLVRSVTGRQPGRRALATVTAVAALVITVAMLGQQSGHNLRVDSRRGQEIVTHQVAAAGAWLGRHNTGGSVISTPYLNPGISNRAVLAMGGYTGLQSYTPRRIAHPRSLPPAGRAPLLASREVLLHPGSCPAARILAASDVRYIFLYRNGTGADIAAFQADAARYRPVFQNPSVLIFAAAHTPCG
jgi:hypothetical protein